MDDLMHKIPEWEREAQEHERKAHALRQIIEGVRALNGDAGRLFGTVGQPATDLETIGEGPRGREAIRLIASEKPGVWTVKDMKAEIISRGWPDPGIGVGAALKRLAASGEAVKIASGVYRFGPQTDTLADAPSIATQERG